MKFIRKESLLTVACLLAVGLLLCNKAGFAQSGAATYGKDVYWNATPNDVNNLMKQLTELADVSYNMEIKSMSQISFDPERNPVLFRSGHYNFEYSANERRKLREFLLAGGMIIYNTGLGSAPFYRSVTREMKEVFPEQPIQRLSSDHAIFHAFYDVDKVQYTPGVRQVGYAGNEPYFDGIEINCRVVVLISRWCMAVGWQNDVKDQYAAYQPDSAYKLGMNIFSYASAMRSWAKNAAYSMKFVDKEEHETDKVSLTQISYDGIWKTRHAGLSVLLQTFNDRTDVPVKFKVNDRALNDPKIFNSPLLYLTGHENFELKKQEILALREYLSNGGVLLGEACCGRKAFDMAFRTMIRQVLPTSTLQQVPKDSNMFVYPHDVQLLGVTPTLKGDLGQEAIMPVIETIEVDGNLAVIYSRFGMAGGWEMCQSPYARGYGDVDSVKLGHNILMYALMN